MGSRRIFRLVAVIVLVASPWLAMADNRSRPAAIGYKLKHVSAQQVAKSLAELFHGRADIKIVIRIGADGKKEGNEVWLTAAQEDQGTIGAFLALVDRRSQLLFPEEVERAMMGDRHILRSKRSDNNVPLPR